jgi:L-ascorbate metabolism protein UlaG (beta-lactamase superfamily)
LNPFRAELSRRAFVSGAVSLTGCASLHDFPFDAGHEHREEGLVATYFSVGCFLIQAGDVAVLTDPYFSHLSFPQVAFGKVVPDPAQFGPYLPRLNKVHAVVAGHSHHDHVLDLPAVCPHIAESARIYGSRTLRHSFAASGLSRELVEVNDDAATLENPGRWHSVADGRIRILPIQSAHPSQYLFFHVFKGSLKKDRKTPPTRISHYQEGMCLAYLVDFMDKKGGIRHRVYINTTSTGWPAGFFPQAVLDEHPVDAALLAMDCAHIAEKGGVSIIDFLKPRKVLFCHWEDFFRPKSKSPREGVKVDLPRTKERLEKTLATEVVFPGWDSTHRLG